MPTVVVTGSEGLVGTALTDALRGAGYAVRGLDLRAAGAARGDTRVAADVARAVEGADGVVHLAAVSRVVWGERDPDACWATNVGGTDNVVAACVAATAAPWLVSARGERVRSKSELILADKLHAIGIDYAYERRFTGQDGSYRLPDFTVEDPASGELVIWEHLGMLAVPAYAESWRRKQAGYAEQGVLPGGGVPRARW